MKTVCIVLLAVAALGHAMVKDCGSKATVQMSALNVTGCSVPPTPPCIFTRGKVATLSLPFTSTFQSEKVTARVHGIIGGVPIPFEIPNTDACVNSGLKCPLSAGEKSTYHASINVLEIYPRMPVTVKWELVDGNNNDIVCILIPVQIK